MKVKPAARPALKTIKLRPPGRPVRKVIDSFRGEYEFLSNFYEGLGSNKYFMFDGLLFRSGEAAFQSRKAGNSHEQAKFAILSPLEAKKLGRSITLPDDWDQERDQIMLEVVRAKFSVPSMGARLLETGDALLIEGNTWGDIYWGTCKGKGLNKLGAILMRVREELNLQINQKNGKPIKTRINKDGKKVRMSVDTETSAMNAEIDSIMAGNPPDKEAADRLKKEKAKLAKIFDFKTKAAGHNTKFDQRWLYERMKKAHKEGRVSKDPHEETMTERARKLALAKALDKLL